MKSKKEQFKEFLKKHTGSGSGKPSAYVRAMEVIEDVLSTKKFNGVSVWDFVNESNVNELYAFVLKQQKADKGGVFENYLPNSYWKYGFCSAALKEYKKFLNEKTNVTEGNDFGKVVEKHFDFSYLVSFLNSSNIRLNPLFYNRFIISLISKPFLILTGLSGSGKTKLAEAFSLLISESEKQYCMIAVGADWTNREPLLGFPNALKAGEYVKPDNGVLDLIIRAEKDQTKPYFLILDEMNMSHVERYFADFLSAMESTDRTISLHPEGKVWHNCDVPAKLRLPENLFIIGTVNIDETTYMFSPKVLDRANVIEFRVSESEMESYFNNAKTLDMEVLRGQGASMGKSFVAKAKEKNLMAENIQNDLMPFFKKLQDAGAEFGYRTASEISRFVKICSELSDGTMSKDDVIDAAIMQKLLPKVHGSRNKIERILKDLGKLCLNKNTEKESFGDDVEKSDIIYNLSYEKLKRMHKRVISDGFTSYAEA